MRRPRIVQARSDGKVHYADTEPGDLYFQDAHWWVVASVGEWREENGARARVGSARPANVADFAGLAVDVIERLDRIEAQLARSAR